MCKIYSECCQNCLLSKDRIVPSKRAKEIIKDCLKNDTHFICHKASMNGEDIVCRSFYDNFDSKLIRFAKWLGVIKFVEHNNNDKLMSYDEQNKNP